MLRTGLDEVELPRRELQVGAVRVEQVARDLLALVRLALLDQPERLLRDHDAVGRHLRRLLRPVAGPRGDVGGVARLGENAEVLDRARLDDVAGEQQPPRQHGAEPMEEHVQAAQRRSEEARRRHADLGVAGDHRDVGHQRDLETAAQRVAADLADGDLREAHQVVVEAERLAIDRQPAALAGTALRLLFSRGIVSWPYQP